MELHCFHQTLFTENFSYKHKVHTYVHGHTRCFQSCQFVGPPMWPCPTRCELPSGHVSSMFSSSEAQSPSQMSERQSVGDIRSEWPSTWCLPFCHADGGFSEQEHQERHRELLRWLGLQEHHGLCSRKGNSLPWLPHRRFWSILNRLKEVRPLTTRTDLCQNQRTPRCHAPLATFLKHTEVYRLEAAESSHTHIRQLLRWKNRKGQVGLLRRWAELERTFIMFIDTQNPDHLPQRKSHQE